MSRGKKYFIIGAVILAIFAPATFAMVLDKGINAIFTIFNTGISQLDKLPDAVPSP